MIEDPAQAETAEMNRRGDRRGTHPNSRKNLELGRFKRGEVSNPRGRPKKELCITSITREQLGEPCPRDHSKTWAKYLSDNWLDLACDNVQAFRELMERLEGKVVFPIKEETPPKLTWVIGHGYVDEDAGGLEDRPELDMSPTRTPGVSESK